MIPIPINPEAIGDPDQTPVVYVGEELAELLGIENRPAPFEPAENGEDQ